MKSRSTRCKAMPRKGKIENMSRTKFILLAILIFIAPQLDIIIFGIVGLLVFDFGVIHIFMMVMSALISGAVLCILQKYRIGCAC